MFYPEYGKTKVSLGSLKECNPKLHKGMLCLEGELTRSVLNAAFLFYFKEELVRVVIVLLAVLSNLPLLGNKSP